MLPHWLIKFWHQFTSSVKTNLLTLLLSAQPTTVQARSWYEYSWYGWTPLVSVKLISAPLKRSIPFRRMM